MTRASRRYLAQRLWDAACAALFVLVLCILYGVV